MLILPAIDLRGGKAVRLHQGDYAQETIYSDNPVALAESFADQGATWLHVVDLDAAKSGVTAHADAIRELCKAFPGSVELGGGIRSLETARSMLTLGVERVIFGTAIVRDAALRQVAFRELGAQAVAGIDARAGLVSVNGWTEDSSLSALEFAKELESLGCQRIIYTDIARDGTLEGANRFELEQICSSTGAKIIASGGIGSLDDIRALASLPIEGIITGKAIYENKFTVAQAIAAAIPS